MINSRPPSVCVAIVVIEIWASGFCTHKKKHRWALWWLQFIPKNTDLSLDVQVEFKQNVDFVVICHIFHIPELFKVLFCKMITWPVG